jgi:pimeloyl-ACP methyl ester carboxylesterase
MPTTAAPLVAGGIPAVTDVKQIRLNGIDTPYRDSGSGPVIVFVHGAYIGGAVWNDTIANLDGFRCIAPTFAMGAHCAPTNGADVSTRATVGRILELLDALDLRDVTLVGNDTGGGLCLATIGASHSAVSRIARLVLTNCDSYEHFPPEGFAKITQICAKKPKLGGFILKMLSTGRGRRFFINSVCATPPSASTSAAIFECFGKNKAVVREAVAFSATIEPSVTLETAHAIPAFSKPVLIAWGDQDEALFPMSHAERLAADFSNAKLKVIPGAKAYVMVDKPKELASEIAAFIRN